MKQTLVLTIAFSIIVSGCAGKEFAKLEKNRLVFGSDTKESIIQKMGRPKSEGSLSKNGKLFETTGYIYGNQWGDAAYEDVLPQRYQSFIFFENKLVGHEFSSSWATDPTDFNHFKVSKIEEGVTTIQEVFALFGKTGGEYIYPLVEEESKRAKVYLYSQIKITGFMSSSAYFKKLVIIYDDKGIVTDVDYSASGTK